MAYDVKFLRGTAAGYKAIAAPDNKTFYYLTDTDQLYLGGQLLSNHSEVEAVKTALSTYKDTNDKAVKAINDKLGEVDISALGATITAAIKKLSEDITSTGSAGELTVETETTTEGMAKSYTLKQGGKQVAVIDIPKDMVVQSGEVVVNPDGQPAGTYVCLTLANAANDKIYIDTTKLVDVYTAVAGAAEVQLAFDGYKVSASLVDGGISTVKLADAVVTTAKIADKNVTKAKLADAVQASLDLADSAVQTVVEGDANGEIKVDGTAVKVHGLGSAAYTNTEAYDKAGAAAEAKAEILGDADTDTVASKTIEGLVKKVDAETTARENADSALDKRVAAVETAVGEGGSVANQIKTAIEALDSEIAEVADQAVTGFAIVDGKIDSTSVKKVDVAGKVSTAVSNLLGTAGDDSTKATVYGIAKKAQEAAEATAAADATSKANKALEDAKADATSKSNKALEDAKSYTDDEITTLQGTASTDAQTKADKALKDAKAYVDEAMAWGTF